MNIGIFTLLDCKRHGGLETYTRQLVGTLKSFGHVVSLNGSKTEPWTGLSDTWQPRINRLLPLMTRPRMRWIARKASEYWGSNWCKQAVGECDVVHFIGTGWELVGFPLLKSAVCADKPMTCWPAVHPNTWGDSPLDIDLYQHVDSVFVLSDHEAAHLHSLKVPSNKFVRCGCAPELNHYLGNGEGFRKKYGLQNKKIVLFIGRKSRGKGYHALREAVAELARCDSDMVLVSIGRDVDSPFPTMDSRIDIDLGTAEDTTKQDALAACDVFALPSEAESFGIVYVEAWSYAKPVICGTAPASQELVTRHGGGVATDGTPKGIATAIAWLLANPTQSTLMGQAGKKAREDEYTIDNMVNLHLQKWEQLKSSKLL